MTTRVELMGSGVSRFLDRRGINSGSAIQEGKKQRFLLGEFADTAGVYDTVAGKVGVDFQKKYDERIVIFDCRDAKSLQGVRHRLAREVGVTREGVGKQNLTTGVDIVVSTDAFGRSKR